jgi:hypothetical protein
LNDSNTRKWHRSIQILTRWGKKLRVLGIHWPELFIQKNEISSEKSGVDGFYLLLLDKKRL